MILLFRNLLITPQEALFPELGNGSGSSSAFSNFEFCEGFPFLALMHARCRGNIFHFSQGLVDG